ncbi:TonB-dependent receptor [Dyadobacter arcticus]|uniref:TonB-linked SusC/RagA family outer membrane protein n=1 Tax=Dyadobacter arcticus TaxID=1078754 RepID=A0ABX0USB3_9BACT|nr:TonB-dependent receptor [Dyadobacter arcticus]NIJ54645.1 TonB-linked SusC/RagA family outer membrane protein [Dyadobacter arcticus]
MKKLRPPLRVILVMIKFSCIPLFLAVLTVGVSAAKEGHAQELLTRPMSLNVQNQEFAAVLSKIEKASDVKFSYEPSLINSKGKVSLIAQAEPLSQVLDRLLKPNQLAYDVSGKYIIITPATGQTGFGSSVQSIPDVPVPIDITGKVTDENGAGLPGVSVVLKGTQKGTTTNAAGTYTIASTENSPVLVFSFVGYLSQEITVDSQTKVYITLKVDNKSLEEVVVIGYGTVRKSDMTGAVSSISTDKFSEQNISRVDQVLQGRAPGVIVTNTVGAPGADVTVRIRGANSALGSNEPLYVIDGYVGADFNLINPNDIATLEVLKDASSTAIYGSRGSNGVIIITTKGGKKGKLRLTYQGQMYQSEVIKKYDVLSAADFAKVVNERNTALNLAPAFSQEQINAFTQNGGSRWQDDIFRKAVGQDHQLGISGATEKTSFLISANYLNQNGVVENSYFKRYSLRSNMTTQLNDKLSFRLNVFGAGSTNFNTQIRTGSSSNPIVQSLSWAPTTPAFGADGTYTINDPTSSNKPNPLALIYDQENILEKSSINAIGGLKYEFIKGLSLNVQYVVDYLALTNKSFSGKYVTNFNPTAGQSNGRQLTLQSTSSLNFDRVINNIHKINAVAVFETQEFTGNYFNANATGLKFPELKYDNLGQASAFTTGSNFTKWSLLSLLGRVNYSLKDRYLLSVSVRRDGSSKFRGDNRYSTFPAVALGWNLANEPFIENLDLFTTLKLRGSWGKTGSQAISPYATESGYITNIFYAFNSTGLSSGIQLGNPGNKDLRWETTTQRDLGLEVGLFNGRLNMEFDYFIKNTTDLLLNRPLPLYAGGGSIASNLGEIENKGWEFSIGATILKVNDLSWKTDFNFSKVKNKVVSLGNVATRIFSSPNVSGIASAPEFVYQPGQPLGSIWGLKYLGTWKPSEAQEAATFGNKPGDARYQDLNGNMLIGAEDFQIIGSGIPQMAAGFNNTVTYKNFTLNFFFQGIFGVDKLNYSRGAALMAERDTRQAILSEIQERYIPGVNESSDFPAFSVSNKIQTQSTMFLEKGDFIRLKNLGLSYNIPKVIPQIEDIKLSVRVANLLTFAKYKGIDPETNSVGTTTDLNQGVDYGSYPNAKTYTIGLSVTF